MTEQDRKKEHHHLTVRLSFWNKFELQDGSFMFCQTGLMVWLTEACLIR